ncbi:MAG: hypothetical protein Q7S22_07735 [Candidatus Micrarchaeota archaeon]|nr:hypothetical protein [Candidatus Micrarchaeota archaeon]
MKILSWNVNRSNGIWDYLHEKEFSPDIFMFQEYHEKTDNGRSNQIEIIHRSIDGKPAYWDTVIAARNNKPINYEIENFLGRVTIGKVRLEKEEEVCLVNIHAQHVEGYYTKWMNNVLDYLEPFITKNKEHLIIGGDLNMGIFFDKLSGRTNNGDLIERMKSYGLNMYPETEQQTYRHHRKLEPKYPDDYLFISKKWTAKCEVLYDEKIDKLSDHNPLVLNIDM